MARRVRRRSWLWVASALLLLLVAVPVTLVLPWRWLNPPTTAFMSRAKAEGLNVRQEWASGERLGSHLPIAVVAAEDQNFPHHHGFDLESIQGHPLGRVDHPIVAEFYPLPDDNPHGPYSATRKLRSIR